MDSAIMAIPAFLAANDPRYSGDMADMLRRLCLLLGFQPKQVSSQTTEASEFHNNMLPVRKAAGVASTSARNL